MITRASSILILAGVLVMGMSQFAAGQDPTPSPTPDPSATPDDAQRVWGNTGSDFNTNANWTAGSGGLAPGTGDVGTFTAAATFLSPNLSSSVTIAGLYFKGTGASGYDLTRTSTQTFTLTANGISIGAEQSNGSAVAIGAENTSGTNTIDVPISLNSGTGISTIFQEAGGTLVINGAISQSAAGKSISKTGGGTLTLTGANTYTGGTSVTAGTLLVNNTTGSGTGTGAVTVNGSGTTLGGTGTISGTVTLGGTTPGAILNPGPKGTNATSGSVGTLTTGALTLTGANTVHIDAFGTLATQWDKLVSTGAISLGTTSALDVTIASGLTFTAGTTYVLLNGTSLTGTFSGIADNQAVIFSGYLFTADYTSTGFDLVAVPEPGTWCTAALALLSLGYMQRRRFARLLAWA